MAARDRCQNIPLRTGGMLQPKLEDRNHLGTQGSPLCLSAFPEFFMNNIWHISDM